MERDKKESNTQNKNLVKKGKGRRMIQRRAMTRKKTGREIMTI